MCLEEVDEKLTVPEEGTGWRRFSIDLGACFQGNMKPYSSGVWLREGNFRQIGNKHSRFLNQGPDPYLYGFHIFKTKYAAEKWDTTGVVRKVMYRKAVASGWQGGYKVVVAKEMKILP